MGGSPAWSSVRSPCGTPTLRPALRRSNCCSPSVLADRWNDESVLPEFNVGALAGHLARSTLQVEMFLDAEEPTDEPITAVDYYARLVGVRDRDSELNVGVRARSEEIAALGHDGLVAAVTDTLARSGRTSAGRTGGAKAHRVRSDVALGRIPAHAIDRAHGPHRRSGAEPGRRSAAGSDRGLRQRDTNTHRCRPRQVRRPRRAACPHAHENATSTTRCTSCSPSTPRKDDDADRPGSS